MYPIASVDLIVTYDGSIFLGLRETEPANNEWFVSGGNRVEERSVGEDSLANRPRDRL